MMGARVRECPTCRDLFEGATCWNCDDPAARVKTKETTIGGNAWLIAIGVALIMVVAGLGIWALPIHHESDPDVCEFSEVLERCR